MVKYVFITGGVVSSLGKGITAASVGCLLKSRGLKINVLKIDPYLNVDPGTMSPYQHGEVFVTDDGAEADLDLGHYERFLDQKMMRSNNITAGQIYETVISRERRGDYLGKTIQVVPHVTDEIKTRIKKIASGNDLMIIEIGGTVGDIEGLPFLESIRQMKQDVGRNNVVYIHVTLVPYIKAAQEMKSKPTQHSVMKLREIGIDPDILVCRTERSMTQELRTKIGLFCNVEKQAVIDEPDVGEYIYEVPIVLKNQKLDELILKMLQIKTRKHDFRSWEQKVFEMKNPKDTVKIAVAGKYTELRDAYKSIWESLLHSGIANRAKVIIQYVNVESKTLTNDLSTADGILVPGGFGDRGIEGKIRVVKYARENKIPFLGICLGMQCAVIEFSRNVLGWKTANSTEFKPHTPYPVIDFMSEQRKIQEKGGTMRLGVYECKIKKNTLAYRIYNNSRGSKKNGNGLTVYERHRHRYELNNKFRDRIEKAGLKISGINPVRGLAEIVEIKNHPFFIGVQFHPEFKSRLEYPQPIFREFVTAAIIKNKLKI